jgi:hypothetical protein
VKTWVEKAIYQWQVEEIRLNPQSTIDNIEDAELSMGFKFPEDFKQLYLNVNGFVDYEWRDNLFSIWSLERIVEEFDNSESFISFSDYCLSVFHLGFEKNKPGIYMNYLAFQEGDTQLVIQSFEGIIGLINCDSKLLYK